MRFIVFIFLFLDSLSAQELVIDPETNSLVYEYSISEKRGERTSINKEYIFYFESIVLRKDKNNEQPDMEVIGNFVYKLKGENSLYSNDTFDQGNRFIVVKGIDQRIKFFNGGLLIKFFKMPDLEKFAIDNNLVFSKNLSSINRGLFRLNNMNDMDFILESLRNDSNVVSIELDLLDPSIGPN